MREYTIFMTTGFIASVKADMYQFYKDDGTIAFYKDGERVAVFYRQHIAGWQEHAAE